MRDAAARPIVCVGGVLWETIFSVDVIPGRGVKLLPRAARQLASGMAPSAAAAIARLGHTVELWALAGDDANGRTCKSSLADVGIGIDQLLLIPGIETPFSTILVDPAGERLVVPYFDPNLAARQTVLPLDRIANAKAVLVDVRWLDGSEVVLREARKANVPTILDADLAPKEILLRLLPLADHVLFSEAALCSLVAGGSPESALRQIASTLGHASVVGVTLGAHGALIWQRDDPHEVVHYPGLSVRAVDTLNAGDVWHGAYVYGLVSDWPMAQRVNFANVAAAIKCERPWGRLGAPRLDEVLARLTPPPPILVTASTQRR